MTDGLNPNDPLTNGDPTGILPPNEFPAPPMPEAKKKSKLWLWITLGVLIPLMLCGLGISGFVYFAVSKAKKPVDVTNNFYKAMDNAQDLSKFECDASIKKYGRDALDQFERESRGNLGSLVEYKFNSYSNINGVVTVSGLVSRTAGIAKAKVTLEKDDGEYKVCQVKETPQDPKDYDN